MKLLVLYRPVSEHGSDVERFMRDFQHQYEGMAEQCQLQDFDTREGVAMASLYDIMQPPAVLILAEDGSLVKSWIGDEMPLMQEVASYLYGTA